MHCWREFSGPVVGLICIYVNEIIADACVKKDLEIQGAMEAHLHMLIRKQVDPHSL